MATSILGAALGLDGRKPVVPEAPNVNAQDEQLKAIMGNLSAFPEIAELTSKANQLSIDELMKGLEKMMPGYGKLLASGTQQIQSLVKGEVPQDVVRNLQKFTAESGAGRGTSGSSFDQNDLLRKLGITSLDLIGKGLSAAERWTQSATNRLPLFNFSSMFITPGEQIQNQWRNEESRFGQQWLKNRIDAMPSPLDAAIGGFLDWIATTGENAAGAYMGQMGSGNKSSQPNYNVGGGGGGYQGQGFSPQMESQGMDSLDLAMG